MDISTISNNALDIQSILINGSNGVNRLNNGYDNVDGQAYYAKKGEPMYMADMDSDEDGTVTLDEFRDYCKEKGMSTREIVKMSQLASAFRTMQAETEAFDNISKLIPNVYPNLKQSESESGYLNSGDEQYNISNDVNIDKRVSYSEYMEYCENNVAPNELKSNTKFEETDSGKFEVTNSGKAVESYLKSEGYGLESTFETVV